MAPGQCRSVLCMPMAFGGRGGTTCQPRGASWLSDFLLWRWALSAAVWRPGSSGLGYHRGGPGPAKLCKRALAAPLPVRMRRRLARRLWLALQQWGGKRVPIRERERVVLAARIAPGRLHLSASATAHIPCGTHRAPPHRHSGCGMRHVACGVPPGHSSSSPTACATHVQTGRQARNSPCSVAAGVQMRKTALTGDRSTWLFMPRRQSPPEHPLPPHPSTPPPPRSAPQPHPPTTAVVPLRCAQAASASSRAAAPSSPSSPPCSSAAWPRRPWWVRLPAPACRRQVPAQAGASVCRCRCHARVRTRRPRQRRS